MNLVAEVTLLMWLLHGTTRARAERILQQGPDVNFVEPGDTRGAENFTFTVEGTRSDLGASVVYALGKAAEFTNERGPAVVLVDVPDDIVRHATLEHLALFEGIISYNIADGLNDLVALCGGVVQFDPGPILDNLLAMWATLAKEIRGVP